MITLLRFSVIVNATFPVLVALASMDVNAETVSAEISEDGSQVTLTGIPFGTAPAIPIHDNFDTVPAGQKLEGWLLGSSHGSVPIYSADTSVTGTQSGMSKFVGENYNSTAEFKNLGGLRSVYLSYYFKINQLNGDPSRNIKLARLSSGYTSSYQAPMAGMTSFHSNGNGIVYHNKGGGEELETTWIGPYADGEWHRAEYRIILSSYVGALDGTISFKIDGKVIVDNKNVSTDMTGNSFEWLTLPYYVSHSPGGDYNVYYDNVHVANSAARVEVCNAQTHSDCTQPIVAEITSWSDTSITIDSGFMSSSKDPHIYVFDSEGNLLSTVGTRLCTKCPEPPVAEVK